MGVKNYARLQSMQPNISVIVPVAPGGSVDMLLDSLKKVDYPKNKIEILVVEGRKPAHQRNMAAKKAKSDFLFFFDDDVAVSENTIGELMKGFETGANLVGGPNLTPPSNSLLQHAHGAAMASFFGAGKMCARYAPKGEMREAGETDLILCNIAIKKKDFLDGGGFPEELYPNEENVLFNRMKQHGKKLIYNPSAIVYHGRRKGVLKIAKQIFNYGRGRQEQLLMQPSSFNPMFLAPTIMLIGLVLLGSYFPALFWGIFLLYLLADLLFSLIGAKKNLRYLFILPWMFPLIHVSYGAGLLFGWIFKKRGPRDAEVRIKKVKL